MIDSFVKAWDERKSNLEEYFTQTTMDVCGSSYHHLVQKLFELVINPTIDWDIDKYDTNNITIIDDGDYQGTLIFVLHTKCYQPSVTDYVYTSVDYGSCCCCDTLEHINSCGSYLYDELPTDNQVKDYMTLCLHLMQNCHKLKVN